VCVCVGVGVGVGVGVWVCVGVCVCVCVCGLSTHNEVYPTHTLCLQSETRSINCTVPYGFRLFTRNKVHPTPPSAYSSK